jgi:hypothetical protein
VSHIRDRDKVEARVRKLVTKLVKTLDLGWLEVQVRFDEGTSPDSPVCGSQCDWQYRRIVMSWNLENAAPLLDDELQLVAVHELCHALIEPIWSCLPEEQTKEQRGLGEMSTENVARVIHHLLKP